MQPELATTGLGSIAAETGGSPGVRVGIIDGPVDLAHPALAAARISQTSGAETGCRATASVACGHGTFVAGILAAARSSRAPALCPGCTFLSRPIFCEALDFARCPVVTPADLATALVEVMGAGARIVNLSVGLADEGATSSRRLERAYDQARRAGVLLVGASGNQRARRVNPLFEHPWIVPVAAADGEGRVDPSSNTGAFVAEHGLLAPGVDVVSLAPAGGYRRLSGSSVAAPFVTGALALLWSLYPRATAEQLRRAILLPSRTRSGGVPPLLDVAAARRSLIHELQSERSERLSMSDSEQVPAEPAPATTGPPPEGVDPTAVTPSAAEIEPRRQSAEPAAAAERGATEPGRGGSPTLEPAQLPPAGGCGCSAPAGPPSYVYAIGTLRPTFPDESVAREFEYAVSQIPNADETSYFLVFTAQEYRFLYIAQSVCWLLEIGGVDTYYLQPRTVVELKELIACLDPSHGVEPPMAVVLGQLGPPAPPEMCGLELPVVLAKQIYYFDFDALVTRLKSEHGVSEEAIYAVLKALEIRPNPGVTDDDRALNYIAFRYLDIYKKAEQLTQGNTDVYLSQVRTEPAAVQATRRIVDVVFEFQDRTTGEESFYFAGVDVTGLFPFLNSPISTFVPVA